MSPHRSVRLQFVSRAVFERATLDDFGDEDVSSIVAYFRTPSVVLTEGQSTVNFDDLINDFNASVDNFTRRGSGYVLAYVDQLTASFVKFRPLGASSFVPTPTWIEKKHAVVNVRNQGDSRCFLWSVLAHLYPAKSHPHRVSNYAKYDKTLDVTNLTFPLAVNDIRKFEKLNTSIAIHCLACDRDKKGFSILYLSPDAHKREHTITLLLLDDPRNENRRHYVYVKNLSRLIAERTKHDGKCHVCLSCLQVFSTESALCNHETRCLIHKPQQIVFPDPENCTLEFSSHQYEFPFKFFLVADLESYLIKNTDPQTSSDTINRHETSGFCLHRVSALDEFQTPPYTYSGPSPMEKFFERVFDEGQMINDILSRNEPMKPMTDVEKAAYGAATTCHICKYEFDATNPKTRHHDHVTGKYLFPACQKCNLALKPRRCVDGYVVPLIMHCLGNYDGHFILKNFDNKYSQYTTKHGKTLYRDIKVLPINSERNLQFQIKNIVFMDSFQFLSASLDTLVATLRTSGTEKFVHTSRFMGTEDFLYEKAHFPYEYFDGPSRFDETSLPPKSAFYSNMTETELSDRDYEHAQRVWQHFDMKTFKQYHDFYLTLDVLLLSDVFQAFRETMIVSHGLDCLYFPSLPSLSLQLALKITGVSLQLITDPDIYLMIESGIRGGLSYVSQRYARANAPSLPDYRPEEPTSYLVYFDANSLYATCQTMSLPVGDFRFLSQAEIDSFDVNTIDRDSPVGYVIEADLGYPTHLHRSHNEFPLAPEHLEVTEEMLSPTLVEILEKVGLQHVPSTKLINNLHDKERYVTHYMCLKFYLAHGMRLGRIHRIISFSQRQFMQPFVRYCNDQRRNAKSDFESGLFKLLANAFYGKSVENVRKRVNARLVTDPIKFVRAVSKANFKRSQIINSGLVLVESTRGKIVLNKPIAIGFTILEYAKLVMYEFYYDCLLPRYGEKIHMCFTDTDSFICHVETPDVHADMATMLDWFDTSNFPADHPLFSTTNKRRLGKFKSETGACLPSQFCGLRSKMYSLWTPVSDDPSHTFVKVKSVQKGYAKRHLRHKQYLHVLNSSTITKCSFQAFKSVRHDVTTRRISKICLSCVDDKRYLLPDGVHSLAYGHRDIVEARAKRAP